MRQSYQEKGGHFHSPLQVRTVNILSTGGIIAEYNMFGIFDS